jgi:hypothetical protein
MKRFYKYRIVHMVMILSFLFAAIIAFSPQTNPSNFLYIFVFIIPVVVFSFSLQSDRIENKVLPCGAENCKPLTVLFGKVLSALIIELIPLIFIILVLALVQGLSIAYWGLILAYILGAMVHIILGLTLSIISRTNRILSYSYIVYILVFCTAPIMFYNNQIPLKYQYFLMFSPAFLSGILIENSMVQSPYSPGWLIALAAVLLVIIGVLLVIFAVLPFFRFTIAKNQSTGE